MKIDLFQYCGHCWVFQIYWHTECSTFTASFLRIWNRSSGIPLPPLALFVVMLPKAHLTLHSRMSDSRWVITTSRLSGSLISFLYSTSVYSCHLFLYLLLLLGPYHFCPLLQTSWQIDGKTMEPVTDLFSWVLKSLWLVTAATKLRCLLLRRKAMTNLDSILKSREITLPTIVHLVKAVVSLVVMCGCESFHHVKADHWRTDAFELWYWRRLWESLYCNDIKPENHKGNQSWIFIGRTDAEAEAPILWPLDIKSWLIRKAPNAGKDWRQEEKGRTEDEMVGWHHWLNGHEFEQALGVGDGQGRLRAATHGVAKSQTCRSDWTKPPLPVTEFDLRPNYREETQPNPSAENWI